MTWIPPSGPPREKAIRTGDEAGGRRVAVEDVTGLDMTVVVRTLEDG
jgi:hypothetical protein